MTEKEQTRPWPHKQTAIMKTNINIKFACMAILATLSLQPFTLRSQVGVVPYQPQHSAPVLPPGAPPALSPAQGNSQGRGNTDCDGDKNRQGANAWLLTGNASSVAGSNFLGTTDNRPLEIKVNSQRAFRLEPNTNGAPNVIAGSSANFVAPGTVGAVIGGGGSLKYDAGNGLKAWSNNIYANFSSIGGGLANYILTGADYGTVAGGWDNLILSNSQAAVVAGGFVNIIRDNSQESTIGGGQDNWIYDHSRYSTIAGGDFNRIEGQSWEASFSGGGGNDIQSFSSGSLIAGGAGNTIGTNVLDSAISGGLQNLIAPQSIYATIGGGDHNTALANNATVAGGGVNSAANSYAAVGGGLGNTAAGFYATIPGGVYNAANGNDSFAAGRRAKANYDGSFVWADSSDVDFAATAANQFTARCTGGAAFVTAIDGAGNATAGVMVPPGSGSWSTLSDRSAKEEFHAVDVKEVLDRLVAVPISNWNYKTQDKSIRHLGPMAQDFRAAFHIGEDDKHISTVDEEGVALAAIQGLNQKVEEQTIQLQQKEEAIHELNKSVAELKKLVSALSQRVDLKTIQP